MIHIESLIAERKLTLPLHTILFAITEINKDLPFPIRPAINSYLVLSFISQSADRILATS